MTVNVAVITIGRSDYGLLHPLVTRLNVDARFGLRLIATGSHLLPEQGMTVNEISKDGFEVLREVVLPYEGDSRLSTAHGTGAAITLLADALDETRTDVVVILGDRFETFAAAAAAVILDVPVAHIHGGELTQGSIDDAFRHAITKMATLHFAAAEEYRRRIIQMGEMPRSVFNVGALAVDNVLGTVLLDEGEFLKTYGVVCDSRTLLVTFHPVTRGDSVRELQELLNALDAMPAYRVLFTAPNVDAGGRELYAIVQEWAKRRSERADLVQALGWRGYLSAARNAAAVVGNSSSGVIEVPALGVPSVDVGARQAGRIHPSSVVRAEADAGSISAALVRALSPEHRAAAAEAPNPYGDGHAAERIAEVLADTELLQRVRHATFSDLECKEPPRE